MPKTVMPPFSAGNCSEEGMLLEGFITGNRIKSPLTGSLMENPPRSPILDDKKLRVNFEETIVITNESMSRKKAFASMWGV